MNPYYEARRERINKGLQSIGFCCTCDERFYKGDEYLILPGGALICNSPACLGKLVKAIPVRDLSLDEQEALQYGT